jgi:hypothetical protein
MGYVSFVIISFFTPIVLNFAIFVDYYSGIVNEKNLLW